MRNCSSPSSESSGPSSNRQRAICRAIISFWRSIPSRPSASQICRTVSNKIAQRSASSTAQCAWISPNKKRICTVSIMISASACASRRTCAASAVSIHRYPCASFRIVIFPESAAPLGSRSSNRARSATSGYRRIPTTCSMPPAPLPAPAYCTICSRAQRFPPDGSKSDL